MSAVPGDVSLICLAKLPSNSNVFTTVTPCVASTSNIWGWFRATKRPSLLGGPGGKGVAIGVGVAVGGLGVAVAFGRRRCQGWLGSWGDRHRLGPLHPFRQWAERPDFAPVAEGRSTLEPLTCVAVGLGTGDWFRLPRPHAARVNAAAPLAARLRKRLLLRPGVLPSSLLP